MEQVGFTFEDSGYVPNPVPIIGLEISNQTLKCQVGLEWGCWDHKQMVEMEWVGFRSGF